MVSFHELPMALQESILEERRHWNVDGHDWWDFEWIEELLGKAGLTFRQEKGNQKFWRPEKGSSPCIRWAGFGTQGDGLSFEGAWELRQEQELTALMEVAEYPELLSAFRALVSANEKYGGISVQSFFRTSRYVHELTMEISVIAGYWTGDTYDVEDREEEMSEVYEAFLDIARWMHRRLEEEYEYLTSDECLVEGFLDEDFEVDEDLT